MTARIVYSKNYHVDIGAHVFPTTKYSLIYQRLVGVEHIEKNRFLTPRPAEDKDILLVHTEDYLRKLKQGKLSPMEMLTLELPYSEELARASWLCAGGTILVVATALKEGRGIHLGGGFHHAFPDHGEGFCVLNDVAIGIRKAQRDLKIKKAMVIDCDLHQGNGTAAIFKDDESVFTFSIHQENNYPFLKPPSDLDIGLPDRVEDEAYLSRLADNIPRIVDKFKPELILYVAGADPYEHDQLGNLRITMKGLKQRDELIFGLARDNKIPIAATLAGGYAARVEDTVQIHSNTVKVALEER